MPELSANVGREVYSCGSTASGARVNNYGARIDLILLAEPQVLAEPQSATVLTTTPGDSSTTPGDVAGIPGDSASAQCNHSNAAIPAFGVLAPSQCM